jgi:hypothetical protein
MTENILPAQFSHLSSYVAEWALPTEKERVYKRVSTDIAKLRMFQEAVLPDLEPMIEFLNGFPNDPALLPEDARHLFDLALMVMESSAPIDLGWPSSDIEDVFPLDRMTFHFPSVA